MRFRFILAAAAFMLVSIQAQAQDLPSLPAPASPPPAEAAPAGLPERIVRPMHAIGPMTLKAEGVNVRLWGIRPAQTAETPLELKALDLVDSLIHDEQQVNCRVTGGVFPDLIARCTTQANQDLALELLANGLVVVDRQQTYNSVFATAYEKAQENARLKAKGIWRYVDESDSGGGGPKWLRSSMAWLLPVALIFGPIAGLLIVALVMRQGLRRLSTRQEDAVLQAQKQEEALKTRERDILASTLEGELGENKNKVEAFLVIYGDLLSSLKSGAETPKYRQAGDIVQKHPAFSKTVFEGNVGKLSLLSMKTAGMVSKLYAALPSSPEYINLEPDVPLDTAVKLVEKVVEDARVLLAPIDQAIAELRTASRKE